MAEAMIVRRDLRYTGEKGLEDIVPPYKKANYSYLSAANRITFGTTYYPLGDASTVCSNEGFLYLAATCTSPGATYRWNYTVTIGNDVYTGSVERRLSKVFKIPVGVTASYVVSSTGSASYRRLVAACSAT